MNANRPNEQKVHFAPTQKHMRAVNPICGYIAESDDISMDPRRCNCPECLDWIRPGHDFPPTQAGVIRDNGDAP